MAKAAKTAIKTKDQKAAAEAKNWTKVIRALRSPKPVRILLRNQSYTRTRSKNTWLSNLSTGIRYSSCSD